MTETGGISVRFFGATAAAVGSGEIKFSTEQSSTAGELMDRLRQIYPALNSYKLLIAVNENYADLDTTLKHGDEVAVFTPVSGG